ncbi:MAG: response regulator transcription factor [Bdellovibrionota bacterium]
MKILLVEDEDLLRANLANFLRQEQYMVLTAQNAEEGLYHSSESGINLGIFDLGLPDFSGVELIKKVRAAKVNFPILVLTARNTWEEKVEALEAGADDYVVKPFQKQEVLARVRALLRRSAGKHQAILEHGAFALDPASQKISFYKSDLELTAYEYKVMEYFMYNAGKVVSKADLIKHLYTDADERDPNIIEVFVRRLRKKTQGPQGQEFIKTQRGQGYVFDENA